MITYEQNADGSFEAVITDANGATTRAYGNTKRAALANLRAQLSTAPRTDWL